MTISLFGRWIPPDALTTKEYKSDWGFAEWQPYIIDWSRDLFDARHAADGAFAIGHGGALRLIAFDRMTAGEAGAASETISRENSGVVWLPVAGLDRSTPLIGLERIGMGEFAPTRIGPDTSEMAVYQPICELFRARRD